jgi:hypothetical protein
MLKKYYGYLTDIRQSWNLVLDTLLAILICIVSFIILTLARVVNTVLILWESKVEDLPKFSCWSEEFSCTGCLSTVFQLHTCVRARSSLPLSTASIHLHLLYFMLEKLCLALVDVRFKNVRVRVQGGTPMFHKFSRSSDGARLAMFWYH